MPKVHISPQGAITNILEESVVQPVLVSISAITLASETVRSILKIDDIVSTSEHLIVNVRLKFVLSENSDLYKKY